MLHAIVTTFATVITLIGGFLHPHLFGNVSLTTLNGSDTLTNFPTTYNSNNTTLNNGKIDVGTTSVASITTLANLASVGTITSGTWNGSTITVSKGGTGSTTLSSNQVLIGNGTSNVGVVNGYGTAGQLLTSNGSGSAPSWQSASFDTTQSYLFSGNNNFTGTTYIKNLNASSTIVIGGSSYTFPANPANTAASSTILMKDANGNLTWNTASTSYVAGVITAIATTTAGNWDTTISPGFPANVIKLHYFIQGHTGGATQNYTGQKGDAVFVGTTLAEDKIDWTLDGSDASHALSGDNGTPTTNIGTAISNAPDDTSNLVTGANAGTGGIQITLSIASISSTSFVIRCAAAIGSSPLTGRCKVGYEAFR